MRLPSSLPRGAAACVLAGLTVVGVISCGDATSPYPLTKLRLGFVAGTNVTDTVQAEPLQALVVQVRRPDGSLARGTVVRFEAQRPTDSLHRFDVAIAVGALTSTYYTSLATDLTDSAGRAKVLVALGTIAGPAKIAVKVPELGLEDTARFTVTPGNAAHIIFKIRDTLLYAGAQYPIGASAADRFGNARPHDVISYTTASGNLTVSGTGVVTAKAEGRAAIVVKTGKAVDTAYVSVVPHGMLAFVRMNNPRGIAVANLDGSGYKFLHPVVDWSLYPQWSPDGRSLVIYEGNPWSGARMLVVGLDSTARIVVQTPVDSLTGLAWPRFAPDGSIYFGGATSSGENVWQVRADGSGLREIPNTGGNLAYFQHPAVSPDGRTLIYDYAPNGGGLAAMDLATGTTTAIGNGMYPVYSPDGSKIAYISGSNVMVADATGANARAITPSGLSIQDNSAPSWTSDGQWVLVPAATPLLVRVSDGTTIPLPLAGYGQVVVR